MGVRTLSEYLLTYLWVGMECVAAVLLFDAFSQRKKRQIAHWIFVACFAFLDATLLNLMSPNMANFGKIVIAVAVYYFFHRLLYIGRRVFSLQSAQTSRILLVNTHHSTLDALLNQKALVARNRSIDVQFRVNDLSAVKIDLLDLTVIISNTLDNAIEACEKLPVQERQIYVQVVLNDNELFYAVRNRSLPIDVSSDRLPVTTKENPSFHGYGLQNVQTTLAKYHSVYAMDYADGWFEFATDLPNTLIS
jgi:hypothetical protein